MSECAKRARKLPGFTGKGITIHDEFSEGKPRAGRRNPGGRDEGPLCTEKF